jgi:hypothetical protein
MRLIYRRAMGAKPADVSTQRWKPRVAVTSLGHLPQRLAWRHCV